ncbi:General stress protein 69 [Pseudovibrio sp. Ad46]|uniref:aldo/keto reductase n=1 Tax=Pseudovibrio sp. Ad46 TaxID=989432 RepID=UPI0007B2E907|nr:aldo/keto reductase [Pseudovibrio sp. Ad46]KZK92499.1 General stress protein 69 [Pseudovibrio sp. Ad46]
MDMKTYQNDSVAVSRLGLGCMRMSMMPNQQRSESIATIHAALEAGINLLNTGDFYGQDGHNEFLIGEALKSVDRDKVFISLKYGTFQNAFTGSNKVDVGPKNVKTYITSSLKRLGLDYVDLYQPARVDIGIPVEDTIGAIADLVEAGYVRNIGLSETDAETIRKAHATHPLSLVEFAYSVTDTSVEKSILPTARELGIGIVAFGAMGFGKLPDAEGDPLMVTLRHMAADKGISIAQLLHGWLLAKGEDIIPLAGSRTTAQLEDTLQSWDLSLSDEDLNRIEAARSASELVGRSMPNMVIKNGVLLEQD